MQKACKDCEKENTNYEEAQGLSKLLGYTVTG